MLQSLTRLTLLSSLLLASGQGALGHGLSDHAKRSIEQTMHISSKRALDGFYVIDQQAGSEWGCSEEKIAALEGAVRDTQALAFMASTVLAEKDSEFSDAYIFWFGGKFRILYLTVPRGWSDSRVQRTTPRPPQRTPSRLLTTILFKIFSKPLVHATVSMI